MSLLVWYYCPVRFLKYEMWTIDLGLRLVKIDVVSIFSPIFFLN